MPKKQVKAKVNYKHLIFSLSLVIVGFVGAILVDKIINPDSKSVSVWAVNEEVKIPKGLESYLEREATEDCKDYAGTDTADGVALFGVVDSSEDRYAKMVYGCSDNLKSDTTIMAAKQNGEWKLIPPTKLYYTYPEGGVVAKCEVLDEYGIRTIVPEECEDQESHAQNLQLNKHD